MPESVGYETGPYVAVATLCERALQEADGTLSLIRIIDSVTIQAVGNEAPDTLPPGAQVSCTLVVSLRAGEARGSQPVSILIEKPDGRRDSGPQLSVPFVTGPSAGANLIFPIQMAVDTAGLYWFELRVGDRLMSKVPLQVNYQFMRGPGAGA